MYDIFRFLITAQTAFYRCTCSSYHCTFCVSLHDKNVWVCKAYLLTLKQKYHHKISLMEWCQIWAIKAYTISAHHLQVQISEIQVQISKLSSAVIGWRDNNNLFILFQQPYGWRYAIALLPVLTEHSQHTTRYEPRATGQHIPTRVLLCPVKLNLVDANINRSKK